MGTTLKSKNRNEQGKNKEAGHRPVNAKPAEERIRQKAQEIYNERLVRGEYGNALEDWQKAEKLLSEN